MCHLFGFALPFFDGSVEEAEAVPHDGTFKL